MGGAYRSGLRSSLHGVVNGLQDDLAGADQESLDTVVGP
jgi:hypothetical protein